MAETDRHLALKGAARRWLLGGGLTHIGEEVACPIHRYRIDVAAVEGDAGDADFGLRVPLFDGAGPVMLPGASVAIECKQERGDFLRDSRDRASLLAARDRLVAQRDRLRLEWIRPREPWLQSRKQRCLFPDDDAAWDYAGSSLPAYSALEAELRQIEAALQQATKFATFVRYRLADRLYIAAPVGLLRRQDLPPGWGLLEAIGDVCERWELRESVPATPTGSPVHFRQRIAKRISWANRRGERSRDDARDETEPGA